MTQKEPRMQDFKIELTLNQLLEILESPRVDPRGKNIKAYCPWCGENEFGVLISYPHSFGCYRKKKCGKTGNVYTLLEKLGRLDEFKEFGSTVSIEKPLKTLNFSKESVSEGFDLKEVKMEGFRRSFYSKYLIERGFSLSDFHKYEVGEIKKKAFKGYVVLPVRDEFGKCIGYLGRSCYSKEEVKELKEKGIFVKRWKNSSTDFSSILYGLSELGPSVETAILVEGFFDKKRVSQFLEKKGEIGKVCLGTFGSRLSPNQFNLLLLKCPNLKTIILAHDLDVLQESVQLAFEYQNKSGVDFLICHFDSEDLKELQGKDPDEYSDDELEKFLSQAKSPIQATLPLKKLK